MGEPQLPTTGPAPGTPPKLDHEQLLAAQREILATPPRDYGIAARALFRALDVVYGKQRSLSKFKVLELVARVPYQTWEQVAYIAVTHVYERTGMARRIHERVVEARAQQDNEQSHLLILEELIADAGVDEGRVKFYWLPQALAFGYYQLSWLMFVTRPSASYGLNADFEDHSEHEYMTFVAEHPEWENTPVRLTVAPDYGSFDSLADLFRQIGHDEHVHKQESLDKLHDPRFR